MKNIFVEGIQGSGKSTLVNTIARMYPALKVCREGEYSPVNPAWCAYMSKQEYEVVLETFRMLRDEIVKNTVQENGNYIVTYTKIRTEVPGFYEALEQYEIYNGRKTLEEFMQIILTGFRQYTDTGSLFECALFQNTTEELILFHMLSDEEIMAFYRQLFQYIDRKNLLLFYLYSEALEENIRVIRKERCDEDGNEVWYQMMLEYIVNSPYGKKHGCSDLDDLVSYFKHRQALELRIVKEVLGEQAVILMSKGYDEERIRQLVFGGSYTIRQIKDNEKALLDDFLYEAIFIPEGVEAPAREIINAPELQVYVKDFGKMEGDICFVAETEEKIIGAVWVRIMDDYGHVEDGVPSFAISLYKEYRGRGIGTAMMERMLAELRLRGYRRTSLAVQKANYAVKMYKHVGFEIVDENEEEYIMVCEL